MIGSRIATSRNGRLVAVVTIAALVASAHAHTGSVADGGECAATASSYLLPCECEGQPCAGASQVTSDSDPDCGGCSFVFTMQITCPACPQPTSVGTSGIVCSARERHVLAYPEDPYEDALVLYLECGACQ